MTIDRAFQILFEFNEVDNKARVFADRVLLRLMLSTSLMNYMSDARLEKDGNDYILEILFRRVPENQISSIQAAIAEPSKVFKFEKNGQVYLGFRSKVPLTEISPKD